MSKQIIAVDIDDVLSSQNEAMRLFSNEHFSLNHSPEDYDVEDEYWGYWERIWKVDFGEGDKRWRAFVENGGMEGQVPEQHAIRVLTGLKKRYDLIVVTARQDEFADKTRQWLDKHFPKLFHDVKFVPVFHGEKKSKAMVCIEMGASYFIDDNADHCTLAAEAGLTALMFGNYGWNRGKKLPKEVIKVKDWLAVEEYFNAVR